MHSLCSILLKPFEISTPAIIVAKGFSRIDSDVYKCQQEGCGFECIREARIRAENHKKICPKSVNIKFGSGQDQIITFEETFRCCQTNHENDKLYSAKNTAIQPGIIFSRGDGFP